MLKFVIYSNFVLCFRRQHSTIQALYVFSTVHFKLVVFSPFFARLIFFKNCFSTFQIVFFYRDICSFIDKLDVIFSGRVVIMSRFQLHSCNSFSTFCCWAAADFTTKQERATDSNNLLINKMSGRKKTNGLKMCKIKNLIKFFFLLMKNTYFSISGAQWTKSWSQNL